MGDNAINDLLLLVLWYVVDVSGFMKLGLAATVTFCTVEDLVYVDLVIAARILVRGSKWPMEVHLDFGCN